MSGIVIDVEAKVDKAQRDLESLNNTVGSISKSVNNVSSSFANMGKNLVTALSVGGTLAVLKDVDNTFTSIENNIRLVTGATKEFSTAYYELKKVADDTRASFASTAEIFSKLGVATANMNVSTQAIERATRSLQMAGAVAGGATEGFRAAMMQLGQGLGAGVLRGEEFNSIMEQALPVAQMIGDSLGVSVGALREMANQGRITSDVVFSALLSQATAIEAKFKNIGPTMGQGLDKARESFSILINEISKSFGISSALGGIFIKAGISASELSDNIAIMAANIRIFWREWSGRLSDAFYPFIFGFKQALNIVKGLIAVSGIGKFLTNMFYEMQYAAITVIRRIFTNLEATGKILKAFDTSSIFARVFVAMGQFGKVFSIMFDTMNAEIYGWADKAINKFTTKFIMLGATFTSVGTYLGGLLGKAISNFVIDFASINAGLFSLKGVIIDRTIKPIIEVFKTLGSNLVFSEFDFITKPLTLFGVVLRKVFGEQFLQTMMDVTDELEILDNRFWAFITNAIPPLKVFFSLISNVALIGSGIKISLNANIFSASYSLIVGQIKSLYTYIKDFVKKTEIFNKVSENIFGKNTKVYKFGLWFSAVFQSLKSQVVYDLGLLKKELNNIFKAFGSDLRFDDVGKAIVDTFNSLFGKLKFNAVKIKNPFDDIVIDASVLKNRIKAIKEELTPQFETLFDFEGVGNLEEGVVRLIDNITILFGRFLGVLGKTNIGKPFAATFEFISNSVNTLGVVLTKIETFAYKVIDYFREIWDKVIGNSWWTDTITAIDESGDTLLGSILTKINTFAKLVISAFVNVFSKVKSVIREIQSNTIVVDFSKFEKVIGKTKDFFVDLKDKAIAFGETTKDIFSKLKEPGSLEFLNSEEFQGKIAKIWKNVMETLGNISSQVSVTLDNEGFRSAISELSKFVKNINNIISQSLSAAAPKFAEAFLATFGALLAAKFLPDGSISSLIITKLTLVATEAWLGFAQVWQDTSDQSIGVHIGKFLGTIIGMAISTFVTHIPTLIHELLGFLGGLGQGVLEGLFPIGGIVKGIFNVLESLGLNTGVGLLAVWLFGGNFLTFFSKIGLLKDQIKSLKAMIEPVSKFFSGRLSPGMGAPNAMGSVSQALYGPQRRAMMTGMTLLGLDMMGAFDEVFKGHAFAHSLFTTVSLAFTLFGKEALLFLRQVVINPILRELSFSAFASVVPGLSHWLMLATTPPLNSVPLLTRWGRTVLGWLDTFATASVSRLVLFRTALMSTIGGGALAAIFRPIGITAFAAGLTYLIYKLKETTAAAKNLTTAEVLSNVTLPPARFDPYTALASSGDTMSDMPQEGLDAARNRGIAQNQMKSLNNLVVAPFSTMRIGFVYDEEKWKISQQAIEKDFKSLGAALVEEGLPKEEQLVKKFTGGIQNIEVETVKASTPFVDALRKIFVRVASELYYSNQFVKDWFDNFGAAVEGKLPVMVAFGRQWDSLVENIGKPIGTAAVDGLKYIGEQLTSFGKWIYDNFGDWIDNVLITIKIFKNTLASLVPTIFTAWLLIKGIGSAGAVGKFVWATNIIGALTAIAFAFQDTANFRAWLNGEDFPPINPYVAALLSLLGTLGKFGKIVATVKGLWEGFKKIFKPAEVAAASAQIQSGFKFAELIAKIVAAFRSAGTLAAAAFRLAFTGTAFVGILTGAGIISVLSDQFSSAGHGAGVGFFGSLYDYLTSKSFGLLAIFGMQLIAIKKLFVFNSELKMATQAYIDAGFASGIERTQGQIRRFRNTFRRENLLGNLFTAPLSLIGGLLPMFMSIGGMAAGYFAGGFITNTLMHKPEFEMIGTTIGMLMGASMAKSVALGVAKWVRGIGGMAAGVITLIAVEIAALLAHYFGIIDLSQKWSDILSGIVDKLKEIAGMQDKPKDKSTGLETSQMADASALGININYDLSKVNWELLDPKTAEETKSALEEFNKSITEATKINVAGTAEERLKAVKDAKDKEIIVESWAKRATVKSAGDPLKLVDQIQKGMVYDNRGMFTKFLDLIPFVRDTNKSYHNKYGGAYSEKYGGMKAEIPSIAYGEEGNPQRYNIATPGIEEITNQLRDVFSQSSDALTPDIDQSLINLEIRLSEVSASYTQLKAAQGTFVEGTMRDSTTLDQRLASKEKLIRGLNEETKILIDQKVEASKIRKEATDALKPLSDLAAKAKLSDIKVDTDTLFPGAEILGNIKDAAGAFKMFETQIKNTKDLDVRVNLIQSKKTMAEIGQAVTDRNTILGSTLQSELKNFGTEAGFTIPKAFENLSSSALAPQMDKLRDIRLREKLRSMPDVVLPEKPTFIDAIKGSAVYDAKVEEFEAAKRMKAAVEAAKATTPSDLTKDRRDIFDSLTNAAKEDPVAYKLLKDQASLAAGINNIATLSSNVSEQRLQEVSDQLAQIAILKEIYADDATEIAKLNFQTEQLTSSIKAFEIKPLKDMLDSVISGLDNAEITVITSDQVNALYAASREIQTIQREIDTLSKAAIPDYAAQADAYTRLEAAKERADKTALSSLAARKSVITADRLGSAADIAGNKKISNKGLMDLFGLNSMLATVTDIMKLTKDPKAFLDARNNAIDIQKAIDKAKMAYEDISSKSNLIRDIFKTDMTDRDLAKLPNSIMKGLVGAAQRFKLDLEDAISTSGDTFSDKAKDIFSKLKEVERVGAFLTFFKDLSNSVEESFTDGIDASLAKIKTGLPGLNISAYRAASMSDQGKGLASEASNLSMLTRIAGMSGLTDSQKEILNRFDKTNSAEILKKLTDDFLSKGSDLNKMLQTPLENSIDATKTLTTSLDNLGTKVDELIGSLTTKNLEAPATETPSVLSPYLPETKPSTGPRVSSWLDSAMDKIHSVVKPAAAKPTFEANVEKWSDLVNDAIKEFPDVTAEMVKTVVQHESQGYNIPAKVKPGVIDTSFGLGQINNATAKFLGVDKTNEADSLRGIAKYLHLNLQMFKNVPDAFRAYAVGQTGAKLGRGYDKQEEFMAIYEGRAGIKAGKPVVMEKPKAPSTKKVDAKVFNNLDQATQDLTDKFSLEIDKLDEDIRLSGGNLREGLIKFGALDKEAAYRLNGESVEYVKTLTASIANQTDYIKKAAKNNQPIDEFIVALDKTITEKTSYLEGKTALQGLKTDTRTQVVEFNKGTGNNVPLYLSRFGKMADDAIGYLDDIQLKQATLLTSQLIDAEIRLKAAKAENKATVGLQQDVDTLNDKLKTLGETAIEAGRMAQEAGKAFAASTTSTMKDAFKGMLLGDKSDGKSVFGTFADKLKTGLKDQLAEMFTNSMMNSLEMGKGGSITKMLEKTGKLTSATFSGMGTGLKDIFTGNMTWDKFTGGISSWWGEMTKVDDADKTPEVRFDEATIRFDAAVNRLIGGIGGTPIANSVKGVFDINTVNANGISNGYAADGTDLAYPLTDMASAVDVNAPSAITQGIADTSGYGSTPELTPLSGAGTMGGAAPLADKIGGLPDQQGFLDSISDSFSKFFSKEGTGGSIWTSFTDLLGGKDGSGGLFGSLKNMWGSFASEGGAGSGFLGMLSGIGKWFGSIGGAATGGQITGAGTATSDSIPTMLSNGEFIVNAKATAKNLPMLHAINGGKVQHHFLGSLLSSASSLMSIGSSVATMAAGPAPAAGGIGAAGGMGMLSQFFGMFGNLFKSDGPFGKLFGNVGSGFSDLFKNLWGGEANPLGAAGGAALNNMFSSKDLGFSFAAGGQVSGPGTGTSDSIPAMLSHGEFVINAAATARHRDLLHQINSGRVPTFATGGIVDAAAPIMTKPISGNTKLASTSGAMNKNQQVINLNITGDISRQTKQEIYKMMPSIADGVNSQNKEKGYRR